MNTDDSIRARKTLKLKADPQKPLPVTKGRAFKKTIEELISLAGEAPFHHPCRKKYQKSEQMDGSEPWRFHVLDTEDCRYLLKNLIRGNPLKTSKGIRKMLAAADAVILGTWLPEKKRKKSLHYQPNIKNMEHIAATAAAIQNLLLAATDRGINAYWSSGGSLRKPEMKKYVGISADEILLGAIFIFPDEYPNDIQAKTGKNADKRGNLEDFMKWVNLNE